MTLEEVLERYPQRSVGGVPDWMLGFFKRRSISFANGETDSQTHVCWFQSRHFTIDLRLPLDSEQTPARDWAQYSGVELQVLANYEGWEASSEWDGHSLSWHADTSLQLHNRWPEPALLQRIGNCMIEFAPSGAYVEDWRLQPSAPGPLIGLRLLEERDLSSGVVRHRGGGLIVCGEHAALVLGRGGVEAAGQSLCDEAAKAVGDAQRLAALFGFETSVAHGSLHNGFEAALSTRPGRNGQMLFPLDGFECLVDQQLLIQRLAIDGAPCERRFSIDTLESQISFDQQTGFTAEAANWYSKESQTLTRYTEPQY
ncbi:MAG TPA: hypothetical protein ENI17_06905 [Pseudomonas xinjiangensis]|uniref:Uncharacterized protein n=2 Tax=root TaxID=1 RepID=A0A7V1BPV3_9GAMM|nr:hypothetical protein [Halopseudomonas xinjiangensis]HEC47343.1 hypothetical protein [Halopseudomonas xinjiangensis]